MDTLLLIKIIAASVSVIIALVAGFIELRLNPKSWLNRMFALFFISTAMAFFIYAIYHSIYSTDFYVDQAIIIPLLIIAQFLWSLPVIFLVMTVFILEKYKKIALNYKHIGAMVALLIIMSIGYFIWVPTLNWESYHQVNHIIDTDTRSFLAIFVNLFRIVLFFYVLFKYSMISRKVEENTKKRIKWFFAGNSVIVVGILINVIGGIFGGVLMGAIGETLIEVLALLLLDIGIFLIVKGFLI